MAIVSVVVLGGGGGGVAASAVLRVSVSAAWPVAKYNVLSLGARHRATYSSSSRLTACSNVRFATKRRKIAPSTESPPSISCPTDSNNHGAFVISFAADHETRWVHELNVNANRLL